MAENTGREWKKKEKIMIELKVLLEDQTVGVVHFDGSEDEIIGKAVTVSLHDENGNFCEKTGAVEAVL